MFNSTNFCEPITKLLEMIQDGIGAWYKPTGIILEGEAKATNIRQLADANAYAVDTMSDACRRNTDMSISHNDGTISITKESTHEQMERTKTRLVYQETTKQANIENVIELTEQMLIDTQEVSDEPVDKRWAMRYFESVGEISDEDTQKIWAKVLAGEIKKKGSFSLRTIETLKNLSKEEAELFQRYSQYFISDNTRSFLLADKSVEAQFEIKLDDMIILEHAGLLSTIPMGYKMLFSRQDGYSAFRAKNLYFLLKLVDVGKSVAFKVLYLTSVGHEMLSLSSIGSDRNYMKALMNSINKENNGVIVSMHELIEIVGSNTKYNTKNLLEED